MARFINALTWTNVTTLAAVKLEDCVPSVMRGVCS